MANDKVSLMMERFTKAVQSLIAIGVVLAAFLLFYALLFKEVNGVAKDVILFVLGCVSSNMTQIISYYFGSSKGSDDKSNTIHTLSVQQSSQEKNP
jgi:hypothetical protein